MKTSDLVYLSLFAALTGALALFPPIPIVAGVPITLQSMGPILAGSILGAKRGSGSQALFLLLVAIGMPLLPGGRGGIGVFWGPAAGFLFSWIAVAFVVGYLSERCWSRLTLVNSMLINVIGGIVVCYLIGLPWMMVMLKLTVSQILMSTLVFIPGDLVKCVLVAIIAVTVKKSYPIMNR